MRNISNWVVVVIALVSFAFVCGAEESQIINLKQAQALAMKQNPDIQNLNETIRQANILIGKAWAILLPNLDANASITRNDSEISTDYPDFSKPVDPETGAFSTIKSVIQEETARHYGFNASITVFNARSLPLIRYAYQNVDYSILSGEASRDDLLLAVAAAYYQVHATNEAVKVAQKNLDNAEEFYRLSQAKKDVGQATRIDVLRAENEVLSARNNLENSRESVDLAKASLVQLTGIVGNFEIEKPESYDPVEGTLEQLIDQAFRSRKDLQAAQLSINMAKELKSDVIAQWIPSVDLKYGWNWNSATGYSGSHDNWNVELSAYWSIFQGGSRRADLYQKGSEIKVAENKKRKLEQSIRKEVEGSYLEVSKRRRNVELYRQQTEVAQETHHLVKRQYQLGLATSLDVLDAYTQLTRIRINRVIEELAYTIASMSLNKSVGVYRPELDLIPLSQVK